MEEILKILSEYTPTQSLESQEAISQYNPNTHGVMNKTVRKDKTIYKPVLDLNGDPVIDHDGKVRAQASTVPVNRVPISMQKTIVSLRKYFMNLRGAVLYSDNDDSILLQEINKVRKKNKYAFKIEEIAERTMSELQAAELWWVNPEGEIKMRVLSPELGDLLLPIFDEFGDMKYFIRQYVVEEETLTDIFTRTENYTFKGNELINSWTNAWNKIPIIYYSQDTPEWYDVQKIIERYETIISNLGDNNDYSGSPALIVKGQIEGFSHKSESGKVFQLEKDAEMSYLSNNQAPEAIRLELETLEQLMYKMSHTPDISIETLKGAGTSGTAFDRVFLDAQLSAESKLAGTFGESMQRSVNLVSAMVRSVNRGLPDDIIEIETSAYRFDDLETFVKNAVLLKGILSNETITKMMAGKFGIDETLEWERVREELGTLSIEDAE